MSNNKFSFKIAVYERHNNSNEWIFQEYIEDDNHWFLNTCGDVCSLGCYSAHYRRDNAPESVHRVYEPEFYNLERTN